MERIPNKKRISSLVKLVVIPLTIIAVFLFSIGVYAFRGANYLMDISRKKLDNFPANVLPVFTNATFYSYEDSIKLEGWFFKTTQNPISTVIMVHGFDQTRLQFDLDTVEIYNLFLSEGYNVLSFDLRHTGQSHGKATSFGYGEWKDVLGAISYVQKVSVTTDVILYAFDTGITASLIAYEKLPDPVFGSQQSSENSQLLLATNNNSSPGNGEENSQENSQENSLQNSNGNSQENNQENSQDEDIPDGIINPGFDKSYIKGFILDTPLADSDDYIKYIAARELPLGNSLGQFVVPYALRLSSDADKNFNIASALAKINLPVHLIYGKYTDVSLNESCAISVKERFRIFPQLTDGFSIYYNGDIYKDYFRISDGSVSESNHHENEDEDKQKEILPISGVLEDKEAYLQSIKNYLNKFRR